MEPAPASSTCMRASLNWRVRCTHASLPPLAFFIFLYELALEYSRAGSRSNRQGYARQCPDCAMQTLRSSHHGWLAPDPRMYGRTRKLCRRELIFVTTSTFTSEAIHAGEIGHSRGWLTMIDGSRLLTIVIACWERLSVHWQARLVG